MTPPFHGQKSQFQAAKSTSSLYSAEGQGSPGVNAGQQNYAFSPDHATGEGGIVLPSVMKNHKIGEPLRDLKIDVPTVKIKKKTLEVKEPFTVDALRLTLPNMTHGDAKLFTPQEQFIGN